MCKVNKREIGAHVIRAKAKREREREMEGSKRDKSVRVTFLAAVNARASRRARVAWTVTATESSRSVSSRRTISCKQCR